VSRIEARTLSFIFAAALCLRAGAAILTETHPIFPAFYYTDARNIELQISQALSAEAEGRPFAFNGTQSQLVQVKTQLALYRLVGPRPLAMKFLNAALGALACAVLAAALLPAFGPAPALASAALCAAWPSNVFFTSQNLKESPTNLLAYLALWGFSVLLAGKTRRAATVSLVAAGVILALTAGALYRAYILLVLTTAMALACALEMGLRRRISAASALYLAAALAALTLYAPASRLLRTRWLTAAHAQDRGLSTQIIPLTWNDRHRPTSPRGLTEFRLFQLEADRNWARAHRGREIATQLFPEARFESWLDVAAFLPKGVFYSLFMPLPGLYPLEGKPGRLMAGLENLVLLTLAALGLQGAWRGPKTSGRALLLLVFAGMAAGAGLLEPDLGSAARHKLLYLPMLFPFAAEEIRRTWRRHFILI